MNRLFYNRCYLSGPIDNAKDFGVGWRQKVQEELTDLDLIFFDPCNKPMLEECACEDLENHQRRIELKRRGDFASVSQMMRTIRCIDLRMADICDFAIVHLDLNVYSTGTHEEIVTLNRRKVPILTHVEQGKAALADWYWGTLPHQMVFGTWPELFGYVRHVAHDAPPIDTYGRWRFFDYGMLYKKRHLRLANGGQVKISPEDHEYLSQWQWTASPHGVVRKLKVGRGTTIQKMDQEVAVLMEPELANLPVKIVHVDGDPLNNQRSNILITVV